MPVVVLMEGLTATGDPPLAQACPRLAQRAAAGRQGRMLPCDPSRPPESGAFLFQWFQGPSLPPEGDLPTGWMAALGCGLPPDPRRGWLRLGFTHLRRQREKLLFVSPLRTGQTAEERRELIASLRETWTEAGCGLEEGEGGRWFFTSPQPLRVATFPLPLVEGESAWDRLPAGPMDGGCSIV
ncbi:MAG: hypothetical protein HQL51_15990 [Magnetococcales bacterium]|nr:hypothetical protein [Magnetococcales bacterium]